MFAGLCSTFPDTQGHGESVGLSQVPCILSLKDEVTEVTVYFRIATRDVS